MEIKKEYLPFMKEIFRALPQTLFIKDAEGKYAFTTKVCDLVNAGPDETIIGKTDYEIQFDKEIGMRYYKEDMDIIQNGISTHTIDVFFADGANHYIEVTKNPIYNDEKEVIGICGICNDITELVNMREKYERLSLHDTLTGLYNRNYTAKYDFDNESSLPCSYIVCDCNNLKKINDKYGHKAGDHYISETADMLKSIALENTVVIRWGGDEFLLITPACSEALHEKMLESIKFWRKEFTTAESSAGLAIGGALRKNLEDSEADVLKTADERMYTDKEIYKKECCRIS